VIAPTTPYGFLRTSVRFCGVSTMTSTGIGRFAVNLNHAMQPKSSSFAFASGLPCSLVRIGAISPRFAWIASPHAFSTARRFASSLRQLWNAASAAPIAWSSWARVHSGASANGLPVEGLITGKDASPATALPSMVSEKVVTTSPLRYETGG
jgi:hypothetical protein